MADPFQDPDEAGEEFIKVFADSMDARQADPTMEAIVAAYLDHFEFTPDTRTIEVGAGAGAVTRRIAARAAPALVVGYEPSRGFVKQARLRAPDVANLSFEVADGAALPEPDGAVDHLVLHTVLTHTPTPDVLLAEAFRVLKPGGVIGLCDVDFSKATLSSFAHDPLDACARTFVGEFVTDPFMVGKLRPLLQAAGFEVAHFDVDSRVVPGKVQMRPWVTETTLLMVARGQISASFAQALVDEHDRRADAGTLYGYQAVATAIGRKPI